MHSPGEKTNITQPTFYNKPYDEIRKRQAATVEYEVDHLATLAISHSEGVETADDGMRRLRMMAANSGVWTMRVRLRISAKEVCVIEKKTEKELETFPAKHIFDPVCYSGSSESSQYKHIIIFIVKGDTPSRSRNEMHIFQSINADEQNLVDDLKAANIGMFPRARNADVAVFDHHSMGSTSSRSAYEDDVKLLNSCLEYIENFVVSLQEAAHAAKQLYVKQNEIHNNSQEIAYLTNKSQPPPNEDYIEVLRQFKFTFNLLPKLKNFLKDPNSPELARQLFHPLSIVVDSCRDEDRNARIPQLIVSPLLTVQACNLLHSCLLPAQMVLWKELGNAWNTPPEKWSGNTIEPYYPSFESRRIQNSSTSISRGNNATSISREQNEYLQRLKLRRADIYVVKMTRTADPNKSKELSIVMGEYLEMLHNPAEKGWWKVSNINKAEGFVPKTIIQKLNY